VAISGNTAFQLDNSIGSDTNGGGFVTGATGTDYSQSAKRTSPTFSVDISTTDIVAAGTTTLTSVSAAFGTTIVGNIIYLQGGTGSLAAGWYQVLTRVSATSITVDRTVATGTGITMNIGGPLASFGILVTAGLGALNVYVKNTGTPYSITSATVNVSGGCVSTTAIPTFVGYTTNRTVTNTDTPPTVNFGVSGVSLLSTRGACINIAFSGNGQTTAHVAASIDSTSYMNCSFTQMNVIAGGGSYTNCIATGNSAAVFAGACSGCVAYANTATPFISTSADRCISINNTSGASGFAPGSGNPIINNCIAYGNAGDGFTTNNSRAGVYQNCHAENNSGWGFNLNSSFPTMVITNCSAYNNTSGANNATAKTILSGFIAITAGSVFVNASGGNFALNNTVNQGALLRSAGVPTSYPTLSTLSYLDIGAAQHQDSGGSSYNGFFIQ
jgi:hypothetical protein